MDRNCIIKISYVLLLAPLIWRIDKIRAGIQYSTWWPSEIWIFDISLGWTKLKVNAYFVFSWMEYQLLFDHGTLNVSGRDLNILFYR